MTDLPRDPKITPPARAVLLALLDGGGELYGRQICDLTGYPSGTIHPLLLRLAGAGWLVERWEDTDPHAEGRPRRHFFTLSQRGRDEAMQLRDQMSSSV